MSELTKEQLLEYVKKQKLKMKKMETEIATLKEKAESAPAPAAVPSTSSADEIATLRTEIESLEGQLSRRNDEVNALSKTIEDAEDEKIQLVSEKNAEIATLKELNDKLKTEGSNNNNLLEEIGRLENVVNTQREQIEAYALSAKEIDAVKVQLDEAVAREAAALTEVANLNASIDQIKVSAAQLDEGNCSYATQISEFKALIEDLQSQLAHFETGEQALRAELQSREAATVSINEQLTASLEIIVGLKSAAEVRQLAHDETAASLTAAQNELQSLQTELLSAQGDLTTAQSDLQVVQNELQVAREETKTAQGDLETANDNFSAVQSDLDTANEKLQTVQNELQTKVEALAESATRNRELEAAVESLSRAPVVSEPTSSVATAITPPPAQAAEASTANGSKKKGKNGKKGKAGGKSDAAETEAPETAPAETPTEPTSETSESAPAASAEAEARVQRLEAELAESLSHRAALEQTHTAQLLALEEKIAQILSDEQAAKVDSAALTARLEALFAEWTASQAQSVELTARSSELEVEKTRLEGELAEASEQLRAASSGAESYAQAPQEEVSTLKVQRDELQASLDASAVREAELNQSMSDLKTQLDASADAEATAQALQNELTTLQAQRDELKAALEKSESLEVELSLRTAALTAQLSASSDAESFAQALQDEISTLRLQRDELQASLESGTAREGVIAAELQHTKADLSAQLEALKALEEATSALQSEHQAALAERAQLEYTVAEKDTHVQALQAELDALKSSSDSSLSESASEIVSLKQLSESLQAQLQESQTADAAKGEEIRQLKETSTLSESNNKKLLVKLKSKMKEVTDLSAELAAVKESATKSAGAEATSVALTDKIASLESSIKEKTAEKAELEGRLKSTNDTLIAGEERISALLREKNKLQEDLFESLRKVENATKEAHTFKTERDLARQQYLDVETKLQAMSSSTRDKIDSLTAKVAEITAYNNTQAAQITTLNETLALSNSEITTLKENAAGLSQTSAKLKSSSATIESLKQQLQETKAAADTKAEASAEKMKKLKLLLTKVNTALQEKDSRLNQLQSANDRAKKFNIVSRIGIVPPQDPSGEELQWCLIYEHRAAQSPRPTDEDSAPQYRWIEARVAHKWMAEGSTLVGAWPQPIQETWAAETSALRARLETERDELSTKYEEVSAQFQAYKVRAQTALKRIGNEDRNERQKVQEAENAEIEKLRGVVQDLREREGDFNTTLAEKDRAIAQLQEEISTLRTEAEVVQNTIADNAQSQQVSERRVSSLQREIETLQEDCKNMKEQYEAADRNNRERRMQQLRVEEEAALRAATQSKPVEATPVIRASTPQSSASEVQDSMLDTSESSSQLAPLSPIVTDHALHAPSRGLSRETSLSTHNSVYSPRGRPSAVEVALAADVNDASDNKLLLFQQADHMLRDSVAILRQENSQLMVEINELKNDFGLREDQVQALKDTVRELESSLCREKEFNAENRRINADYLVNILRNFLMSTEASERAKLVPVLCQILHLGAEESRIIGEKWAVRPGGLVGWLLPPRPAATAAVTPKYQQHATGMSIDRGDGAKTGGADLTYDHSTGAGIDVNGY